MIDSLVSQFVALSHDFLDDISARRQARGKAETAAAHVGQARGRIGKKCSYVL